jgi:hypothetical protein
MTIRCAVADFQVLTINFHTTHNHLRNLGINMYFIQLTALAVQSSLVCFWRDSPQWARASSLMRFLDQTQPRNTLGRTPLGECSARRRDLYLTTHNTHNRQTSMPPVGFEPIISAGERPQIYALDRAGTGLIFIKNIKLTKKLHLH